MRTFGIFVGLLALAACASSQPALVTGSQRELPAVTEGPSVAFLRANFREYIDVTLRLKAYLISTDHGAYLIDDPNGQGGLRARFSKSESQREAISALGEKMLRSHLWHPYGQIHGTFEGHLRLEDGDRVPSFEISSEVE